MKLGFSTAICPDWDLDTIIDRAGAFGYDTVELCNLQGEPHLPASMTLTRNAEVVASKFRDGGVEPVCLATRNCFHWKDPHQVALHQTEVREVLALAGGLGCPFVRVFAGDLLRGRHKDHVQAQVIRALRELAPVAAACRTTLVLENGGGFGGSRDTWFVLDAVNHPAVRCCWNPRQARLSGDRDSLAVPRLGRWVAMTRVTPARLDGSHSPDGASTDPSDPEIERCLDLLRGLGDDGPLIVDAPPDPHAGLADAASVLPAVLADLRAVLERRAATPVLTAYKGDKNAPKFASLSRDSTGGD